MWAEQEKYKNHFLQTQLGHLRPQQINEMVVGETVKNEKIPGCFSKGKCQSALYFENRAELAYGFLAIPKLMKELNVRDDLTQRKAITSLSEYLVNPLYAQRAINENDIVRRCQNLFLRMRIKYRKGKDFELQGLLVIFYNIAIHRNGARQIVGKNRLLDQFYEIVCKREKFLEVTSKILSNLSSDKENCFLLIDEYKVFDKLWDIWNHDPFGTYHSDLWLHLTHFLELVPQEAIKKGFFEILYNRISRRMSQYYIWEMKCFGLILRCPEGQERLLELDGIKFFYKILTEECLHNYENVVFALMHALFAKSILWRCREFTNLPLILTELAKDSRKSQQQLFCLQALREMAVMPIIKRFIKENCLDDIRNLDCELFNNDRVRKEIIYWLEREIYHTSNLRKESLKLEEMY